MRGHHLLLLKLHQKTFLISNLKLVGNKQTITHEHIHMHSAQICKGAQKRLTVPLKLCTYTMVSFCILMSIFVVVKKCFIIDLFFAYYNKCQLKMNVSTQYLLLVLLVALAIQCRALKCYSGQKFIRGQKIGKIFFSV